MIKGLTKKLDHLTEDEQNLVKRRQKFVRLFFLNPLMQQEVENFRVKYDMPRNGFNLFDPNNGMVAWYTRICQKYPQLWERPPLNIRQDQARWLRLSVEEQETFEEPFALWEPSCYINIKPFQHDLRYIYDRFNKKIPLNDFGVFEDYAIYNSNKNHIGKDDKKTTTVRNESSERVDVVDVKKNEVGKVIKLVHRVHPPWENITEGTPTLLVTTENNKVTSLMMEFKPNTTLDNIHTMWNTVEKFQQQMEGYISRVRDRDNLVRDVELFRKVNIDGKTIGQARSEWNKSHPNQRIFSNDIIRAALARLDRIFKP